VGYGGWNERGVRVIGPDRTQLRWDMVGLDSQLPDDHRARLVWAFVEGLDLSEFYDRIKARDAVAGQPWASAPGLDPWGPPREVQCLTVGALAGSPGEPEQGAGDGIRGSGRGQPRP
jgi:hypothetical protein